MTASGRDLDTILLLPAGRVFNFIDHLFVEDALENGKNERATERMRAVVASVYDRPYRTSAEMYGESSDEDDLELDDGSIHQFSPKGHMRPSDLPPLTLQDENGFAGLDAPLN